MTTEIQQENNVSECLPKKDRKAYQKAWREANKYKIAERNKSYYESNKDKIIERNKTRWKSYYESNKDKISEFQKAYRESNKEKRKEFQKAYSESNKEKLREYRKTYTYKRIKEDPLFAAKIKLRICIGNAFRRIKQNKPTDTQILLGCSWQEAKEHFEHLFKEGMSWENHGEWHIDHIRPVSSFSENELHLMNHISNLQPLWAEDNLAKKATIPPTPSV